MPEAPTLGFSRYGRSTAYEEVHQHADCLEIRLSLRGALTLLSNGKKHKIMTGDFYLNKPEDIHCLTYNFKLL